MSASSPANTNYPAEHFHPQFEDGAVKVLDTRRASLQEAFNEHSLFVAELILADPSKALPAIGTKVTWKPPTGKKQTTVFNGIITRVEKMASHVRVTAASQGIGRDLVRRTLSYGGKPAAEPIDKLFGIDRVLDGIDGASKLEYRAHHVWQCDETDWELLLRLAALHGLAIVSSNGIQFYDGKSAKEVQVLERQIRPDSELLDLQLGVGKFEALTWDESRGTIPDKASASPVSPAAELLRTACERASKLAGKDPAQREYFSHRNTDAPDGHRATLAARRALQRMLTWRGEILLPEVGVGMRLKLPDTHAVKQPMLVVRRTLTYLPEKSTRQLVNAMECVDTAAGEPLPPAPCKSGCFVLGQVAAVDNAQRMGRVKVNFPWHRRSGQDPTQWEGVWSHVAQPFAGISNKKQPHGSFMRPAPFDWVRVWLDPRDYGCPVVHGATYRGNAKVPGMVTSPTNEQLLFAAAGVHVLVRAGTGSDPSSLVMAVLDQDSGEERASFSLSSDGKVSLFAKEQVRTETKKSELTATERNLVKGETVVHGNFNVKE